LPWWKSVISNQLSVINNQLKKSNRTYAPNQRNRVFLRKYFVVTYIFSKKPGLSGPVRKSYQIKTSPFNDNCKLPIKVTDRGIGFFN